MVGMGDGVFADRMSVVDRMELDSMIEQGRERRRKQLEENAGQQAMLQTTEIELEENGQERI